MPSSTTSGSSNIDKFQSSDVDMAFAEFSAARHSQHPAIRFTRALNFEASVVRIFATACQLARPPERIRPVSQPPGAFTSRLPAGRSPFLPLGMTTTVTGLLCWRDLHPLEWQLASLHENRIKECQIDMFADRTPAATMRTNQLRLWFASMAYVLMCAVRRIGLAGTQLAQATCGTIRQKLLKIGARVTISVRRVKLALASACPYRDVFCIAAQAFGSATLQARLRA